MTYSRNNRTESTFRRTKMRGEEEYAIAYEKENYEEYEEDEYV
ncbi:MAG: hypothetical protein ACP5N2_03255 [Candidatus Nanoarchaeia archaeon]